ncbi:MAG TPA: FAD:protein FMN transferase [Candidatus Dormibacteraeota bacterium]|nr:FAD:protein FMN transferase [Candidatus Dormibacteraeota bacterium]
MTALAQPEIQGTTWRALGTHVDVLVTGGELDLARGAVERVLAEVDAAYSRFRPDSELMEVNRRAGETVTLSPLLARAIGAAIRAAQLTDGLCDPTIGQALLRIGYDDDFSVVAASGAPIELRVERAPGWRTLQFEAAPRTFRAPEGVTVDLGSTGKALAADLAAEAAVVAMDRPSGNRSGALVSLGGDLAIAGAVPAEGWQVRIADDSSLPPEAVVPGQPTEIVTVREGAIATSSTMVRQWRRGRVTVHHLIDPRTGLPARSPWRTVSVAAATCVDANAAATAALIRGEDGPAWLSRIGLASRFVRASGRIVRAAGWPDAAP